MKWRITFDLLCDIMCHQHLKVNFLKWLSEHGQSVIQSRTHMNKK